MKAMRFPGYKWGEDAAVLVGAVFVVWLGLLLWGAGERVVRFASDWNWPCQPCDRP